MFVSLWYESIFEIESVNVMMSFVLNLTYLRASWNCENERSQVFHVNSSNRRNSTNVIQNIALRLRLFLSFDILEMIQTRISSSKIFFSFSRMRLILKSSKVEISWLLQRCNDRNILIYILAIMNLILRMTSMSQWVRDLMKAGNWW